jgi:uncharacterized membrane protein
VLFPQSLPAALCPLPAAPYILPAAPYILLSRTHTQGTVDKGEAVVEHVSVEELLYCFGTEYAMVVLCAGMYAISRRRLGQTANQIVASLLKHNGSPVVAPKFLMFDSLPVVRRLHRTRSLLLTVLLVQPRCSSQRCRRRCCSPCAASHHAPHHGGADPAE